MPEVDEEELEPLFELVEELEFEVELVVLLAVGVEDAVLSVLDVLVLLVVLVPVEPELDPEDELLVCVALGTVAATASEPASPLAATIAVIVAVRALPCRTERSAPSASMLNSVKGSYRSVTPKLPEPSEKIMNAAWAPADIGNLGVFSGPRSPVRNARKRLRFRRAPTEFEFAKLWRAGCFGGRYMPCPDYDSALTGNRA